MEDNDQQQLIFSGRTVEEALKNARAKLALDPFATLDYEVINEGKKKKFLFFGGSRTTQEVRVLIKFGQPQPKPEADLQGNTIKQMVEDVWNDQQPNQKTGSRQRTDRRDFNAKPNNNRRGPSNSRRPQNNNRDRDRYGDRDNRRRPVSANENRTPAPAVEPEVMTCVGEALNLLFKKMGMNITATVESSVKNPSIIRVNSEGEDQGWLVGQQDLNSVSIEELITKMVKTKFGEGKSCRLYFVGKKSSGGRRSYGQNRRTDEGALKETVLACLEKIQKTGESQTIGPMNAYERRLVHTLVADEGKYKTESVGDGPRKKVKITQQP
jgi:predicted RNA-binding protein Jag